MPELFRKILSPVYFDETSQEALEYARHFAQRKRRQRLSAARCPD